MSLSLRLMTSSSAMDKPRASADWSHHHRLPAFELIAQRGAVISRPRTPPSNSRIESDLALDCEPCRDQKTEHHQAHDRAVICEPLADAVLRPVAPLELYDGVHSACPASRDSPERDRFARAVASARPLSLQHLLLHPLLVPLCAPEARLSPIMKPFDFVDFGTTRDESAGGSH